MAIVYVTDTEAASTDNNTVTTPGIDTSGANLIVIAIAVQKLAGNDPSDSNHNTWTGLTAVSSSSAQKIRFYYCLNPVVGSSHTFSFSETNTFPTIAVVAFSGATAFGQESGTTATQPGSITPAEDNEALVTFGSHSDSGTAPTVNSPFSSNLTASIAGAGPCWALGMAYEIQTTATARNPTWTLASSPTTAMATFKAAAAGGVTLLGNFFPGGNVYAGQGAFSVGGNIFFQGA